MVSFRYFLVFIVYLLTATTSFGATYKISVTAELVRFSIDGYYGPATSEITYLATSKHDPVMKGYAETDFARKGLLKSAFSRRGKIIIEDAIDYDTAAYKATKCSGVFYGQCQFTTYLYGLVNSKGFDLYGSRSCCAVGLSSETGLIYAATDDDYGWTNALGFHQAISGESLNHGITGYRVQVVPAPWSGALVLSGLALLFGLGRLRDRKNLYPAS